LVRLDVNGAESVGAGEGGNISEKRENGDSARQVPVPQVNMRVRDGRVYDSMELDRVGKAEG